MAMTYQNFASLGVNLNRQKYGPLDISNVFTSAADLKYYLTKGTFTEGVSEYWYKNADEKIVPYPYEGQVLATVIDGVVNVYALALDAEGNFTTQEIGAKVEVDGTTIVKDSDGKISIVAPVEPDSSKTYNFSYANGVYSWVEVDTATAAGQAQAISGLTDRTVALETTVGNAESGLVKDVADNTAAIGTEKTRAEAAEKALSDRIDAIDFVDSDELADAIKDFATTTYVDGEIDKIEETISKLNHFTTEVVNSIEDVKEVGVLYLIKDESVTGIDKYNEYIVVDDSPLLIGDTTTDLSNYYNKTDIDGKVETIEGAIADEVEARESLAAEVEATYATKSALDEAVDGIENDLLAYAKTADVTVELAKKLENATISHSTETIPESVTLDGTTVNIVVDAYTKAETLDKISEKITEINGGESAGEVLGELNSYKETNDARVGAIETKNSEQDISIAAAQAQADKGVQDAAKVAADLATANGLIADNTREIGVAKNSIDTVNTTLTNKITDLEEKDTEFTTAITALEGTVEGHTTTVTEQGVAIKALQDKDLELAALIQGNTDKFAGYYTKGEVDAAVQGAIDAIPDVDFTPYAKTSDVNAALDLKANASDVYTKDEADLAFMTEGEVDARINALIVGSDPEGGKAITDIQNLVKYVDENAGEIAALVTANDANTAKLEGITTTVTKYVTDALAAIVQPKASEEVTVATDGTLGLGKVSTDKLELGDNTLVLDGGTAIE